MTSDTLRTILVTGATRGIGRTFVAILLQQTNVRVIAAVRHLQSADAKSLSGLPRASGTTLLLVKIDSSHRLDAQAAFASLKRDGVEKIDTIIANAGIAHEGAEVSETDLDVVAQQMEVNLIGPWALFKAFKGLLHTSTVPKFVALSTEVASLTLRDSLPPVKLSAYGASKVALNYLVNRLAAEEPWLTCFAIHPGVVNTALGDTAIKSLGGITMDNLLQDGRAVTKEEAAQRVLDFIEKADQETTSGLVFNSSDGKVIPW
ncbi:NAD(P)-binding protein [Acaromyces ingoldii]|uniref:NAD(P)-binding protein n=1 Tax=Acaromyces ingoldii TaxID=215250 RepID=A0A316YD48_9BASI|nr:NAD(P)-binding protein [Acaromyces ingoldii]PWN86774.1 NAD(P)-binding protein [Acaromyces ingoldii]